MNTEPIIILAITGVVVVAALIARKVYQHFRATFVIMESFSGLLYRHGKFVDQLSPGRHVRWGGGWSVTQVDLRQRQAAVTGQELLSADNVGIKISAAVTYQITDAHRAVHSVQDFNIHLHNAVQLALRSEIGALAVETLLEQRNEISSRITVRVAAAMEPVGILVTSAEVRDVMFPGELRKAFTEVLRAQKEAQATLERARGESASLRNLANAARMLENNPALMNLRLLQTLGAGANTYVMGVPAGLVSVGKAAPAADQQPET